MNGQRRVGLINKDCGTSELMEFSNGSWSSGGQCFKKLDGGCDDDWRTPGNPGREKAHKAARAVADCHYVWPIFRPGHRAAKDTDYNDLHRAEGLNALARQMGSALRYLGVDWPATSAIAA